MDLKIIAKIHTDFPEKFGVPRQSNLAVAATGKIIFEPAFRNPDAFTGLDGFNYLWILWEFSENLRENWSATVRPPRLGGNAHMGVFATRSPFRPNPIGLSSVHLDGIDLHTENGPVLYVSGIDMVDQTPIYDIKPYLSYTDSHPDAFGGFTTQTKEHALKVSISDALLEQLPQEKQTALLEILAQDPRPSYQKKDVNRIYGLEYAGFEIKFQVEKDTLFVKDILLISTLL